MRRLKKDKRKSLFEEYYNQERSYASEPWWLRLLDRLIRPSNPSRLEFANQLLPRGKKLLDIGCGEGEFLFRYAAKKFEKMVGVDISSSKIRRAKRRATKLKMKKVKFQRMDVDAGLPYSQSSFDAVVCCALLEHVSFPKRIIEETYRVLTKDGILILEVPNVAFFLHRLSLLFARFPETGPIAGGLPGIDEEHIRFFTLESLRKILERNGFEIRVVSTAGRFFGLRRFCPSLLGADLIVKCQKR